MSRVRLMELAIQEFFETTLDIRTETLRRNMARFFRGPLKVSTTEVDDMVATVWGDEPIVSPSGCNLDWDRQPWNAFVGQCNPKRDGGPMLRRMEELILLWVGSLGLDAGFQVPDWKIAFKSIWRWFKMEIMQSGVSNVHVVVFHLRLLLFVVKHCAVNWQTRT